MLTATGDVVSESCLRSGAAITVHSPSTFFSFKSSSENTSLTVCACVAAVKPPAMVSAANTALNAR